MSWASRHIIALRDEGQASFRPRGNSMEPIVKDNELVLVKALGEDDPLEPGDVVLCTVKGRQYFHLVKLVEPARVLIGNNRGVLNGWTPRKHVYGKMVKAEQDDQ